MNPEIIKGQLRSLIIAAGGIGIGWFASKGYISSDQVAGILNSPVFLSLATAAAGFIWSAVTHTHDNAVAVVAAMAANKDSPVRGIILEPTHAGHELAESISAIAPGTVAPVGTIDANKIASR